MKNVDLDNDYELEDIEIDDRFIIAKKEMLLTFGVQISYTLLMLLIAYGVGKGDPNQYKFILGMPAWWFYCLLLTVGFIGLIFILTQHVYKNMSVDAYVDIKNEDRSDE